MTLFLRKTMSNWSKLLSRLNFLEIHPKPMSCGCRRLQGFCMTRGFIFSFWRSKTSRITRKSPAKKCQTPAKNVKFPQIPKSHTNNFFWNPPDHIIDCKPYDKCKVTEKFVATPGILNFTRKQEMLEISRKRMLQVWIKSKMWMRMSRISWWETSV